MVIRFLLSIFFAALAGVCFGQNKVQIEISKFRSNNGVCQVCLFDNPAAFKGTTGQPVACQQLRIANKKTTAVFTNLRPGTYAIMTFHDANSNGRMDTNFLGIPSEGYGATHNNLPFAAAPTFNANKFLLSATGQLQFAIRLRNL